MTTKAITIPVSESVGEVSGEYILPENAKCMMTLAHGAGAGMQHAFLVSLANSLAETGIATLRFNFPFTEQKKKRPDFPAVAHKTIESAIQKVWDDFPELPVFTAGKSFGGRMTSQYLSGMTATAIKGIIFYGFPLHPAGKPGVDRAAHLKEVQVPMLFLQGTRDTLASLDLIEQVCGSLPLATLVKIEGADHAFKAGKLNTIEMLTRETNRWVEALLHH